MYQKPIKEPHLHLVKWSEEIQLSHPYFFLSFSNISVPYNIFYNMLLASTLSPGERYFFEIM